MSLFKQFATNRVVEADGVEITFEPNLDGTVPTLIVARTFRESQRYRKAFERITKPYKNKIDRDELDEVTDTALMQQVFAEVSVKGWKNWRLPVGVVGIGKGDDGSQTDIDFSVDNLLATFRALPELFKNVAEKSTNADTYRVGELEEMAKNY